MIEQPSIRTELAAAVRQVNARYDACGRPENVDTGGGTWKQVEREVDVAIAAGDRSRAMKAINAWRDHALAEIDRATNGGHS